MTHCCSPTASHWVKQLQLHFLSRDFLVPLLHFFQKLEILVFEKTLDALFFLSDQQDRIITGF